MIQAPFVTEDGLDATFAAFHSQDGYPIQLQLGMLEYAKVKLVAQMERPA